MKFLVSAIVFGISYLFLSFNDFIYFSLNFAITKGARSLIYVMLAGIVAVITFFIGERFERKIQNKTSGTTYTTPMTLLSPRLLLFVFLLLIFLPLPQFFCVDGCELMSSPLILSLSPFLLIPIFLNQFLGNVIVLFFILYLVAKKFRDARFMPELLFVVVSVAWIFFAPIFYERWAFILLGIIWSALTLTLASRFSHMPQQGIPFLRLRDR